MDGNNSAPTRRGVTGPLILALGLMGAAWIVGSSAIRIAESLLAGSNTG